MTTIEREARAESEKRYPSNHLVDDPFGETGEAWSDPYGYSETAQSAFVYGAEWQASRPVTDEEVEAACIGFYNDVDGLTDWKRLASADPSLAEKYRSAIRIALEAARALADKETP